LHLSKFRCKINKKPKGVIIVEAINLDKLKSEIQTPKGFLQEI
jgi:hypothetical protein